MCAYFIAEIERPFSSTASSAASVVKQCFYHRLISGQKRIKPYLRNFWENEGLMELKLILIHHAASFTTKEILDSMTKSGRIYKLKAFINLNI